MSEDWRVPSPLPSPSMAALLLGVGVTWGCYYLHYICKRPRLVASGALRQFLESHCPVVRDKFCPTFWCVGGRIQTIVRVLLLPQPPVSYRNEVIGTADGGQISLDWSDNEDSAQFPESSSRPTVLLLPGLTGNSRQSYILHLVQRAQRDGYRMVLLNYLASRSSDSHLQAALVFSTPWDVFVSTASLEKPLNYLLFNRNLVSGLRNAVHRYRDIIGKVLDVDHILKVSECHSE
ncbi:protein ABHD1 [Pyxicephalus adspersus]|uniref:protein ABHD1 n=1 Tax=Pyxicephalus adspersus TaxID=30357 RepID=UPI003B5C996B